MGTVQELVRQRETDAQRTKMMLKLKEDRIARLQARAPGRFVQYGPSCLQCDSLRLAVQVS